jgi:hypothetical protein
MMRVTIPAESGNKAIQAGRLQQLVPEAMARMKPEAAYFTADGGSRTAYFFLDMQDQSQMPQFAEPFFMELNAKVDFQPVMNGEDLKTGLSRIG